MIIICLLYHQNECRGIYALVTFLMGICVVAKDTSRVAPMKIDTSIVNTGECTRLGHVCLLKTWSRWIGFTPVSTPRQVVNPVMHKISVGCWLLDPDSMQRDYLKRLHVSIISVLGAGSSIITPCLVLSSWLFPPFIDALLYDCVYKCLLMHTHLGWTQNNNKHDLSIYIKLTASPGYKHTDG